MHLTRLALTDFRSYPELSLELGPGVTTFRGPNGEGKTNLVEAVGYLATLGSHRVASDAPLVRRGAERAVLRGADTVWVLVYSPPEVQDKHGGAVLLEPAVNMMNFRDGDLINVQGQIQNGGQRAAPWLLVVYRAADVNLIERAD